MIAAATFVFAIVVRKCNIGCQFYCLFMMVLVGPDLSLTDSCYVSNILTVGSEPVISFFNKGKSIFWDLPFCFLVDFTIYVISTN